MSGVVILDLDDTLYPERDFLLSGMRAVSAFASRKLAVPEDIVLQLLDTLLAAPEGRNQLFDRLLRHFDAWTPGLAATLVHVYRTHEPHLQACADVTPALRELREAGFRLGLVTDGPSTVQRAKFRALGLASLFDALVFTDDLPPGGRKPSVVPFRVIAELLGVPVRSCTYIADDPSKDFLGPRELGMRSVRIRRSLAFPLQAQADFPASHEADVIIDSLRDIVKRLAPPRH